jgi:hypothetical protein
VVSVYSTSSLSPISPSKQKTGNPGAISTVGVVLVRRINGAIGEAEGRIMSSGSGYKTLTRALAHEMRSDTKLSAILWRERNDLPDSGLTSVRAHSLRNPPLDLGITIQDLVQNNNRVTLIISS